MHVVVSSSRVVFHHCIISFVIVCFGFVVVPGVSLHVFLTGPLFVFVFDALHSSSYCLLSCLFWCFAIDLLLVARGLFLLYV